MEVVGRVYPRSMVGHDQHVGVVASLLQEPAHRLVGKLVLLQKHVAVDPCSLGVVGWVGRIDVLMEEVVGHVRVGIYDHQEVVTLLFHQVHTVVCQLLDHVCGGANTLGVGMPEELRGDVDVGEPLRHLWRIGVGVLEVGGRIAGQEHAVHGKGRVGHRHGQGSHPPAFIAGYSEDRFIRELSRGDQVVIEGVVSS